MLELTGSLKVLLQETAAHLESHERRRFMAQTVTELGRGGQRLAERELGWHRDLIRKEQREVENGIICIDQLGYYTLPGSRLYLFNEVEIRETIDPGADNTPTNF